VARIVWLASYPKSGNTWLRAFIYNLIEQPARPGRIAVLPDYFESESDPRWYLPLLGGKALKDCGAEEIFALRTTVHRHIASSRPDGTVFVKTHNQFGTYKQHPLHEMSVSSGAICIVRNPLDVVLSTADHFGLGIDDAIDFMADDWTGTPSDMENVVSYLGSWSGHAHSWSSLNHPQIIVLRYEDMLDKPLKAFGRVARLLGLGKDRERIRRAIRFSSFTELSKQEAAEGFIERSPTSKAFFRKGKKNQWVEALSDDQVARIIERHREIMAQFRYIPPKYR
jgi:hypothetical protein